jgi:predicted phage terminase large subunit-like protein
VRDRLEYPELRATAIALAKDAARYGRRPETILIEDKASGQSLIQDLNRAGIYNVEAIKPEADKVTRMSSQTAVIANGAVFLPIDAPWLGVLEHELIAFPLGRYTDQVDSVSQVLKWFCALNDEPGLLAYYRGLAQQIRGPIADGECVPMRPKDPSCNILMLPGLPHVCPGLDGVFLVPARFVKGLRASGLWMDVA